MLHTVPKVLALTSGVFVLGVLAFTVHDRFQETPIEGQLISSASSMTTTADEGGWLDGTTFLPVDITKLVDKTSTLAGATAAGTTGGTTAGTTGGTTGGTPPPPPPDPCAPKAEKTLNGKEVCKCGSDAATLEAAYKDTMTKALKNLKAPACAAECPEDTSINPNPTSEVNGPVITRTHVAGRGAKKPYDKKWVKANCRLPQLVACFTATGDAKSERFCKKPSSSSSSSSTPPPPPPPSSTSSSSSVTPPPPPTSSSTSSSVTWRCCSAGTSFANCSTTACSTNTANQGSFTDFNSCVAGCQPVISSSSAS